MKFVSDAGLSNLIPLEKIHLADTDLNSLWLEESDLQESNFHNATLTNANLGGSNLKHSDFSGANLQGTNLTKATEQDRQSATLGNFAQLDGSTFKDAIYDRCTRFPPGTDTSEMKRFEIPEEEKCRYK